MHGKEHDISPIYIQCCKFIVRVLITNPRGNVMRYEQDDKGNVVRMTDAAGHVTTYTYDARIHLVEEAYPHAGAVESVYRYALDADLISANSVLLQSASILHQNVKFALINFIQKDMTKERNVFS